MRSFSNLTTVQMRMYPPICKKEHKWEKDHTLISMECLWKKSMPWGDLERKKISKKSSFFFLSFFEKQFNEKLTV